MMIEIKKRIILILHKIMDTQDDIRLTRFLIEFNKSDKVLILNPQESASELIYIQ